MLRLRNVSGLQLVEGGVLPTDEASSAIDVVSLVWFVAGKKLVGRVQIFGITT